MSIRSERLRQYLEAERAILQNQSYTLEGRTLTRANLSEVRRAIDAMLSDGVTLEGEMSKRRSVRTVFVE